jgi:2-phospho-L-lactate guanylyltransferase
MRVLLPLKEFAAAKQRLGGVLSAAERARLFQAMVEDVLFTLSGHGGLEDVVICSSDPAASWLACYYEVAFLSEAELGCAGLNAVVNAAAQRFAREGLRDLLVVHGDLPLLSGADIAALLAAHRAGGERAVTIAPDRRRTGTNLLAWRSLPEFSVGYGRDSFQRHCARARQHGVEPTVCDLPGGSCDIDEPEDLCLLLARQRPGLARYTMSFLQDSGIAARLLAIQRGADNEMAGKSYDTAE